MLTKIFISAIIVYAIGLPFVIMFDKWKKEMDDESNQAE